MAGKLSVLKTYKIYIDGAFPRTESGRYYPLVNSQKETIANICLCSRKDFRNAVVAARKSYDAWAGRAAFNRGQILYRIGEILEGRKAQFVEELIAQGYKKSIAENEVRATIDLCVYYSGWADKYQAVSSSVNPVATAHFNFSVPEPMGVVSILAPDSSGLYGLVASILPVITGGNTCVVLASEKFPLCAVTFAEVLATSDVPAGVVNILTGKQSELIDHMSQHMDVNAILYCGNDRDHIKRIQQNCSMNVKRMIHWEKSEYSLERIMDLQEIKTTWHPIEVIGVGGAKY